MRCSARKTSDLCYNEVLCARDQRAVWSGCRQCTVPARTACMRATHACMRAATLRHINYKMCITYIQRSILRSNTNHQINPRRMQP